MTESNETSKSRMISGEFSVVTLALAMVGFESMKDRTHPSNVELVTAYDRALEEIREVLRKNNRLANPLNK